MSATNITETEILELLFQNQDMAGIGDAGGLRGSVAEGNWYISLHTADPGEGGDQDTNEATYTSYARVAVPRNPLEWAVAGDTCDNVNAITFPQATGGSESITHFGIGQDIAGTGVLRFKGPLTSPLAVSNNITPAFAAGDLNVTAE